jgi:hypothetical protein
VDDDARPRSIDLDDRVINEIDECFLDFSVGSTSQLYGKLASDIRDACAENLVEELPEALSFELRESIEEGFADDIVASAGEGEVGVIRPRENVVGTLEDGEK